MNVVHSAISTKYQYEANMLKFIEDTISIFNATENEQQYKDLIAHISRGIEVLQKLSTQNIPPTAISNNTQTAPIAKPAEYQNIDDQNCLQVMNDTDRILEAQTSFQISAEYDQEGESEFKSTDFISEGNDSFFLTRNLLSVNELEQTSQFSVYDEINSIFKTLCSEFNSLFKFEDIIILMTFSIFCFSSTRMSFQSSIHPKRG